MQSVLLLTALVLSAPPQQAPVKPKAPQQGEYQSVATFDGVEVLIEGYYFNPNSIRVKDWKRDGDTITCVATWTYGKKNNFAFSWCDGDGVRFDGGKIDGKNLVEKQPVKWTFKIPKDAKQLRLTRN